jgi:hypothetical protein
MEGIGFRAVTVEREHLYLEQDLSTWVEIVRRRDTCSQLLAIPDEAYEAAVRRLERGTRRGNRFGAARRSPLSAHRSWREAEPGFCIISARSKPDYHVGKDDDLTRFKAG